MKKLKIFIAFQLSLIFFTSFLNGQDAKQIHNHHHKNKCKGERGQKGNAGPIGDPGPAYNPFTFGSFYASSPGGTGAAQTILMTEPAPTTAVIQFPGTNSYEKVFSLNSGEAFTVLNDGNYEISWNLTADGTSIGTPVGANIQFSLDLIVNDNPLNSIPQTTCITTPMPYSDPTPYYPSFVSAAGSTIIPLSANDKISLLLTVDGDFNIFINNGGSVWGANRSLTPIIGSGVNINSAAISIQQVSH